MIRCLFFSKSGLVTGFELEGHAGAGRLGKDIVCAAASSAAILTANTITEIAGCHPRLAQRDGFLSLRLDTEEAAACRIPLEGFRLHMTAMQQEHPQHIKVITEV